MQHGPVQRCDTPVMVALASKSPDATCAPACVGCRVEQRLLEPSALTRLVTLLPSGAQAGVPGGGTGGGLALADSDALQVGRVRVAGLWQRCVPWSPTMCAASAASVLIPVGSTAHSVAGRCAAAAVPQLLCRSCCEAPGCA